MEETFDLSFVRFLSPEDRCRIRTDARLFQRDLAREVGCSATAISYWESGVRQPRGELGARYGRVLRQLAEFTRSRA